MDAAQRHLLELGLLAVFGVGALVALGAGAIGILLFPEVKEGMTHNQRDER
jgi:hypothetical protein